MKILFTRSSLNSWFIFPVSSRPNRKYNKLSVEKSRSESANSFTKKLQKRTQKAHIFVSFILKQLIQLTRGIYVVKWLISDDWLKRSREFFCQGPIVNLTDRRLDRSLFSRQTSGRKCSDRDFRGQTVLLLCSIIVLAHSSLTCLFFYFSPVISALSVSHLKPFILWEWVPLFFSFRSIRVFFEDLL